MAERKIRRDRSSADADFVARSEQSEVYRAAVEAVSKLLGEEGLNHAERAIAEGIAMARFETFAHQHEVVLSDKIPCIWRLAKGRCNHMYPPCQPPHDDHGGLWLKNGKPYAYTSDVYYLTTDHIRDIYEFASEHDLDVSISSNRAMHFPGRSLLVMYTKGSTT